MGLYDDFYRYARKARLHVNEWTRKEIGRDAWKRLLQEFAGLFAIDRTRGSSLNGAGKFTEATGIPVNGI